MSEPTPALQHILNPVAGSTPSQPAFTTFCTQGDTSNQPDGTPVCAECYVASTMFLFGQQQAALNVIAEITRWGTPLGSQWQPAHMQPKTFDQGVGAAAQDVLAIVSKLDIASPFAGKPVAPVEPVPVPVPAETQAVHIVPTADQWQTIRGIVGIHDPYLKKGAHGAVFLLDVIDDSSVTLYNIALDGNVTAEQLNGLNHGWSEIDPDDDSC